MKIDILEEIEKEDTREWIMNMFLWFMESEIEKGLYDEELYQIQKIGIEERINEFLKEFIF